MASSKKNIEIIVKPTIEELRKRLAKKRTSVMDLRTPYARAAVLLDQWVQKNFKTEGGKVGGWTPFALGGRWKTHPDGSRTFDPKAKLLQDEGRLKSSFSPFASTKHAGIGSDLPYAKDHHEGIGLPARQLLPDHNPAYKEVLRAAKEIMTDYNATALRK